MTKAIMLFSGGLDSTLAIKMMQEMGIELFALTFASPFCRCAGTGCGKKAAQLAREFKVPYQVVPLLDEYVEMIKKPKYGYGSGMNPCIDCRIMMFKKAAEKMKELEADFIVTGEVLGQRPMSQNMQAIRTIDRESGLKGYVLRPLSAQHFPPTLPEETGMIDRKALLDIRGRSRKKQIKLITEKYNFDDYACPAGGCLLTDKEFSQRLRDLKEADMLNLRNARLLMFGRFFPLTKNYKLIVGRNEKENNVLKSLSAAGDYIFEPQDGKGPTAIGVGVAREEELEESRRIVKRYCKYGPAIKSMRIE